jgi:hypothetical protein
MMDIAHYITGNFFGTDANLTFYNLHVVAAIVVPVCHIKLLIYCNTQPEAQVYSVLWDAHMHMHVYTTHARMHTHILS